MELILASTSPSRKAVLALSGIPFKVVPSNVPEVIDHSQPPREIVKGLAKLKADKVAQLFPDDVVVGCDSIVWIDGHILGKPLNEDEAFEMLRLLCGHTHYSYTGVCIRRGLKTRTFSSKVAITFYDLTASQIRAYIQTGESIGKAGAYSSQEGAATFIKKLNGNPSSVLGLPLSQLMIELEKIAPELKGILNKELKDSFSRYEQT